MLLTVTTSTPLDKILQHYQLLDQLAAWEEKRGLLKGLNFFLRKPLTSQYTSNFVWKNTSINIKLCLISSCLVTTSKAVSTTRNSGSTLPKEGKPTLSHYVNLIHCSPTPGTFYMLPKSMNIEPWPTSCIQLWDSFTKNLQDSSKLSSNFITIVLLLSLHVPQAIKLLSFSLL